VKLVVDTSALMAILLAEPEADRFASVMVAGSPAISAGTLVEAYRVAFLRRGPELCRELDRLLDVFEVEVVPVDRAQARLAEEGQRRFGRGRGEQPAVLNFGDLFAYALARALEAPLLFKGADFRAKDVTPAVD
jgi:ribonuclease VapC